MRYVLRHNTGRHPTDRYYSTLAAAKGQLTRKVRHFRSYSYVVEDVLDRKVYGYDETLGKVVFKGRSR